MSRPRFKGRKVLEDYWLQYYCNHLCTLCGNSGVIDTRTTAVSAAGFNSGRLNWCICPNGQCLRAAAKGELPTEATMHPKIKAKIDPDSLELSWFKVRKTTPFSDEEMKKLTEWGCVVHYDNGAFAMVTIPPTRLDEFAELESVIEIS